MRKFVLAASVIIGVSLSPTHVRAQHWSLGGNMGVSLLGGTAGFQLTPVGEYLMGRGMAVGTEFSINTQQGTPLIWHAYFKYYVGIDGSRLKPYASVGPLMGMNVPNGPSFGLLLGVGVNIPIAKNLYLTPDIHLGPVYGYGGGVYPYVLRGYYWGYETYGLLPYTIPSVTILAFSMRSGIRYEL
jgi:hypothetical protein